MEQKLFCPPKSSVQSATHAKALMSFFSVKAEGVMKATKKAEFPSGLGCGRAWCAVAPYRMAWGSRM